jgi:hypothetical protein
MEKDMDTPSTEYLLGMSMAKLSAIKALRMRQLQGMGGLAYPDSIDVILGLEEYAEQLNAEYNRAKEGMEK